MAVDYFLKIDGIPGESSDSKHKGEIDIESFSWSEEASASAGGGGGGGAGKVTMREFQFVARTSKASPKLFLACADGHHIKSAVLTGRRAAKDSFEFLRVSFTDVLVAGYALAGSPQSEPAVDQISLNFATIALQYKTQRPDGSVGQTVRAGWDLKANKKI
jgi:type VI secretion system secreted protein Hcp